MIDFLITYILFALAFFSASIIFSTQDCKEINAKLSREVYRVNYKACLFKSLFFPLTIVFILAEFIKTVWNKGA